MMHRRQRTTRILLSLGLGFLLAVLGGFWFWGGSAPLTAESTIPAQDTLTQKPMPTAMPAPMPPRYERIAYPHSEVHVVTVPSPEHTKVRVAVTDALTPLAAQVTAVNATAAINAGFFDPNNGLTTSYVVVEETLAADPRLNARLVDNPDLTAYMDRILNRSEFRRYDCGGTPRYDITLHNAEIPADCRLIDAVGAGPQLLPQDSSYEEAFIDYRADGSINRDALGSRNRNARSAVGIKPDGSLVLVMAAQRPGDAPSGLTFAEMSEVLTGLGVEKALNLDGGSSSALVFEGATHYGRLDREGNWVQRPVKSILWVEGLTN